MILVHHGKGGKTICRFERSHLVIPACTWLIANLYCAGEAGLEPTKSRKARASKANQQTSHIEDVSDSEEDPGHSMSM